MNESTFERCEHDRENPYVMISREMAQDKSISPKAKGVLLYLLSLPRDWRIYHSQLQDGLGVGEDYVNSAMEELIANGYADRTRERVKGIFQPYKYKIREFKKINPNGKNQPGLTGPVNPALQKKEKESKYTKKTTTEAASAAAAVSSKEESKKIHECLKEIDIPNKEKLWLTSHYDEQTVKEAIAWATSPQTTITTTLAQAIKWACKERPEIPKKPEDTKVHNKSYAEKFDGKKNGYYEVRVLSKYVEIAGTGQAPSICIEYEDKKFKQKLDESLKKCRIL